MKKLLILLFVSLFTIPGTAFGLSLDQAKSGGLVGETPSGYLQAVQSNPSAEVAALIREINAKRTAEYKKIAREYRQSVDQVAQLAGKKAMKQSPKGSYVLRGGRWVQK